MHAAWYTLVHVACTLILVLGNSHITRCSRDVVQVPSS
jgi:hypothetical protein